MDDPKEPIIYSLDGKGDEHYFKINPNTGEITVVKLLDREIEDNLAVSFKPISEGYKTI